MVVYDVTDPHAPIRPVRQQPRLPGARSPDAGDLGPEGVTSSRRGQPHRPPLLVVANEISGTVGVFEIAVG